MTRLCGFISAHRAMSMRAVMLLMAAMCIASFSSCGSAPTADTTQASLTDADIQADESDEAQDEAVDANPPEQSTEDADEDEDAKRAAEEEANAEALKAANDAAMEKVDASRQAAIDAGAEEMAAEQLAQLDALYAEAKNRAGAGEDMTKSFKQLSELYTALEEYSLAMSLKERIDEAGYQSYDEVDYGKGEAALAALEGLLQDDNAASADVASQAHIAYASYNRVLLTALKTIAQKERRAAFIAKRNADGVYASVSRKEDYNAAVKEFRAGDASYAMQNPQKATEHYTAAREAFEALYNDINDKLSEAEAAIREAQEASSSSEEYARQADTDSPLEGEHIDGIEEHDAVLLEDVEYDNPEESIEVIPESIDDMDDEDDMDDIDDTGGTGDIDDAKAIDSADEMGEGEKLGKEYTEADNE